MANMVRWDPFREMMSLREAMDSLFENAMIQPSTGGQQSGIWGFPLDVTENEDNIMVKASIPGVNPEDLDVTVNGDVLTIKGETRHDEEKKNERYYLHERRFGRFERSIQLPTSVKTDAVQAEYQNGVLTLTLPKSEEVKPKRIAVKGSQQGQKSQMLEGQAHQR